MQQYTFHRIARDGRNIATTHYECESDACALAHAMEYADRFGVEIWRGYEKLAYIEGGPCGFGAVRLGLDLPDCDPLETGSARPRRRAI